MAAALAVCTAAALAGCATTVDGTAVKAGAGPRNDNSAQRYPNLLKECDVLTTDILAETVGADPLDIQAHSSVPCAGGRRPTPQGWSTSPDSGTSRKPRKRAQGGAVLNYQIETRAIAGVPSIVMRTSDPNGACGVASDAGGVVGWWINPQAPGIDACSQALKLMELTLATNSRSQDQRPVRVNPQRGT